MAERQRAWAPMGVGIIQSAVVLKNEKTGKPCLMGVAQFGDSRVNFQLDYDWPTLDIPGFLKDLRETLARDLGCAVKSMDIRDRQLLGLMEMRYKHLAAADQQAEQQKIIDAARG